MPKERFHLLVTDMALSTMSTSYSRLRATEANRLSLLLGTIAPDLFFYDLPTFRLSAIGRALHRRMEGIGGVDLIKGWIETERGGISGDLLCWLIGFASHLLTDAFWHPAIEAIAHARDGICRTKGLSRANCHHWTESELEAYWLARMGPEDGYIPFLSEAGKPEAVPVRYSRYLWELLDFVGFQKNPCEKHIRRCSFWQAFLLRQFAHPFWARRKALLLRTRPTRFLGALIVPSAVCHGTSDFPGIGDASMSKLFQEQLFLDSLNFLSSHLHELPALI